MTSNFFIFEKSMDIYENILAGEGRLRRADVCGSLGDRVYIDKKLHR
jgi:hypothetical protein